MVSSRMLSLILNDKDLFKFLRLFIVIGVNRRFCLRDFNLSKTLIIMAGCIERHHIL